MKLIGAALALLCCDSSWVRLTADPARFQHLHTVSSVRPNALSPAANVFALWAGNTATLYDLRESALVPATSAPDPKKTIAYDKEGRGLAGHTANIHDAGWSRDGRFLATTGFDGVVRVWEVATGAPLAAIAAHTGYA